MSINIEYGFKIDNKSSHSIAAWVGAMASGVEDLQRTHLLKAYASLFARLIDRSFVIAGERPDKLTEQVASHIVYETVRQRQAEMRKLRRRDPQVDLDVTFVCRASRGTGGVLGYIVSEFAAPVHALTMKMPPAADWSFWDSSDPDARVPADEWSERDSSWREALRDKGARPFKFDFTDEYVNPFVAFADLVPHLPSLKSRAAEIAQSKLFDAWLLEQGAEKQVDAYSAVSSYLTFRDVLVEDTAWAARLAEAVQALTTALPDEAALATWWDTPQQLLSRVARA